MMPATWFAVETLPPLKLFVTRAFEPAMPPTEYALLSEWM